MVLPNPILRVPQVVDESKSLLEQKKADFAPQFVEFTHRVFGNIARRFLEV